MLLPQNRNLIQCAIGYKTTIEAQIANDQYIFQSAFTNDDIFKSKIFCKNRSFIIPIRGKQSIGNRHIFHKSLGSVNLYHTHQGYARYDGYYRFINSFHNNRIFELVNTIASIS